MAVRVFEGLEVMQVDGAEGKAVAYCGFAVALFCAGLAGPRTGDTLSSGSPGPLILGCFSWPQPARPMHMAKTKLSNPERCNTKDLSSK